METMETKQNNYYYYKDKIVLDILALSLKGKMSVFELKKSSLGFLTHKKSVAQVLAKRGNGIISSYHFENVFAKVHMNFSLTLSK